MFMYNTVALLVLHSNFIVASWKYVTSAPFGWIVQGINRFWYQYDAQFTAIATMAHCTTLSLWIRVYDKERFEVTAFANELLLLGYDINCGSALKSKCCQMFMSPLILFPWPHSKGKTCTGISKLLNILPKISHCGCFIGLYGTMFLALFLFPSDYKNESHLYDMISSGTFSCTLGMF